MLCLEKPERTCLSKPFCRNWFINTVLFFIIYNVRWTDLFLFGSFSKTVTLHIKPYFEGRMTLHQKNNEIYAGVTYT